jgi:tetratricopeptide (TPR) repeat protein
MSGCASSGTKPQLSIDAQAEALSHFSMGLLAESAGESQVALDHFESAIQIDPSSDRLYSAPIAIALREEQPDRAIALARQLVRLRPELPTAHLLLGQTHLYSNQPEEAEAILRSAVGLFPKETRCHASLARFLIGQERKKEALSVLKAAQQMLITEADADILNMLGTLMIDQARDMKEKTARMEAIERGIERLEESLEITPDNPARLSQLGFAYLIVDEPEKALNAFTGSYAMTPGDPTAARQLLDMTVRSGKINQALEQCDLFARNTATELGLWLQYLAEIASEEWSPELTKALEDAIEQDPAAPDSYYAHLSSLYIDAGQTEQAERTLRAALERYPEDQRLRTVFGYLLLRLNQNVEAYESLKQVKQGSSGEEWIENPFFSFNFMIAAQRSGRSEEAADALSRSYTNNPAILDQTIQTLLSNDPMLDPDSSVDLLTRFFYLNPDASETLYYLSLLQADQKNYEEALSNAIRFKESAGDEQSRFLNGSFYYQIGAFHERLGQLNEAEDQLRKAIEMGPELLTASAENYIAYMWAEKGEKLEMCLELIQSALKVDPDNPAFIDTLGWVYFMMGRTEDAIRELQRAASLEPTDPTILEHLGDAYMQTGDKKQAIEFWEKALELSPNDPDLLVKLGIEHVLNPDDHPAEADTPEDTPHHP